MLEMSSRGRWPREPSPSVAVSRPTMRTVESPSSNGRVAFLFFRKTRQRIAAMYMSIPRKPNIPENTWDTVDRPLWRSSLTKLVIRKQVLMTTINEPIPHVITEICIQEKKNISDVSQWHCCYIFLYSRENNLRLLNLCAAPFLSCCL